MLYPSDTQTVQAQALGVHGGSGKRRGDFGLMQCHMPMDVKIIRLRGVEWEPHDDPRGL